MFLSMKYSVETSNQIITVLSIFFGFYVTSASLVLTGDAVKTLHKTIDVRGNRRLTHTLRDYYSFGLSNLLVGLVAFIIISLFFSSQIAGLSPYSLTFSWAKFILSFGTTNLVTNVIFVHLYRHAFF